MLARDRVADARLAVSADLERTAREIDRLTEGPGPGAGNDGARLAGLEETGARLRGALVKLDAAFDALLPPAASVGEAGDDGVWGSGPTPAGERFDLRVSLAGPVREPTAAALFAALAANAQAVQRQLTFLDEKDVGERGDGHIAAILAILANACQC